MFPHSDKVTRKSNLFVCETGTRLSMNAHKELVTSGPTMPSLPRGVFAFLAVSEVAK